MKNKGVKNMAFQVVFEDKVHGTINEYFEDFQEGADFWNNYADTPTCIAGEFSDCETGEVFWSFDDTEK
jgi:hypothetical protein